MRALLTALPTEGQGLKADDLMKMYILKRPQTYSKGLKFIQEWLDEFVLRGQAWEHGGLYWRVKR